MDLGQTELAVKELRTGLQEDPESPRAMAYAALADSLLGDGPAATQWARRALTMDASNVLARQVLILCDDRPEEQLLAEAQSALGDHPQVFSAFAQRAFSHGDFASALNWAESALRADRENQSIRAIATESFVMTSAQRAEQAGHLTEAERGRIKDSGDILDGLWQQLEPALQRPRASWLRASAIAAQLVDDEAALDRSRRLLALSPTEREFVRVRVRALVAHEKFDEARALLESSEDLEPEDSVLPRTLAEGRPRQLVDGHQAEWRIERNADDGTETQRPREPGRLARASSRSKDVAVGWVIECPRVVQQEPVSIHGLEKGHGSVDDAVGGNVTGRVAVIELVLDAGV